MARHSRARTPARTSPPDDPLERLAELHRHIAALQASERDAVARLRRDGTSWGVIGDALGISKQTAHYRYGR